METRIPIVAFASGTWEFVNGTLNTISRVNHPGLDAIQKHVFESAIIDVANKRGNGLRGWVLVELPHISTNSNAIKQQ